MVDLVAYTTCLLTDYTLGGKPILPIEDAGNVAVEGQGINQNMPGHWPLGVVSQHVTAADCSWPYAVELPPVFKHYSLDLS